LIVAVTTVREVMSKEIVSVQPTATVAEAATIMGAHHVGSALVLEEGRPAGIFTERDILRALAADFDAAQHPVAQWMTPDPLTVSAETDVREARDLMLDGGFRHLPVMEQGRLAGVVSLRDLSRTD
jgi:CBS domain-containing protein